MILAPNYAELEQAARLKNARKLRSQLNSPAVQMKIENWAARWGLEPEFVRYRLLTDDVFALHFAIDPTRQTFHQKVAAKHIANLPLVECFEQLPSGGASAEYVVHGLVVRGETVTTATNHHGKSIDFKWSLTIAERTLKVVATHKHTKSEGGSQDNQFADVKRFLDEAKFCRDHDTALLAICDGPYYTRPYDGKDSRLLALEHDYPGPRSRVCTIETLPGVYSSLVGQWVNHHKLDLTKDQLDALALLSDIEDI